MYPVTATTVTADLSKVVINLTNFFALPGIRTRTDHLQGDVLVLVVYLKPEAENTRNLTNKTTYINSKLPLLFKERSLQKVQGQRTAQGHRAGVDVDVTPPTGVHPPNPATLCDRTAQGSKS